MPRVQWIPVNLNDHSQEPMNITYFPPEPAFAYYLKQRKDSLLMKCPAFSEQLKNTYVIKSPYDISFKYDKESKKLKTNKVNQEFYNDNINFRVSETDPIIVHFFPRYLFLTDSKNPLQIIQMPLILRPTKIGMVTGAFDISKWVRPIEFAFELYDENPIHILRGDPLFLVKFISSDATPIHLEKGLMTPDILALTKNCIRVKKLIPQMNLKTLYSMSEDYVNLMQDKIWEDKN